MVWMSLPTGSDRDYVGILTFGAFGDCRLGSLLPLQVDTDQTAEGTSKTDEAVVEAGPAESGGGNCKIAKIGQELKLAGSALTKKFKVSQM